MRIDYIDNNLIVFLNKKFVSDVDFSDKVFLEDYFRDLFIKFKDIYDIDISGSYEIIVFRDKFYGAVLKLIKDDVDYYDYYDSQIDMKIVISKYDKFLYKLNNSLSYDILSNCSVYLFDGDMYLSLNKCDYINYGFILENSEIIYGDFVSKIIREGFLIDVNDLVC